MRIQDRWGDWWRMIASPDSTWIEVPRTPVERSRAMGHLRRLPAGSPVVMSAGGIGARGRSRRFARAAQVDVLAEYLAYPGLSSPAFLVRNARRPLRYFWSALAAVPPGTVRHLAIFDLAIAMVRRLPAAVQGEASPGRLLVGRRR
jgi:hypothetical protein